MGFDACFQAIPENCELLARARQDRDVAQELQFFLHDIEPLSERNSTPTEKYVSRAIRALVRSHPGLKQRRLYADHRSDQIVYLLSPARREDAEDDDTLVYKAFNGSEHLQPEARAGQGCPIGFLPKADVHAIAEYFDSITVEQLHEYYDPSCMFDHYVYKIDPSCGEKTFQHIWDNFVEVRDFFREAAAHDEAVITMIDWTDGHD